MTINNKNIDNLFYIFVTSHLIFWTLIPTITNHNLPLDTIEALAWGSNLDWGFNKHPPMSAFFPEIFFQAEDGIRDVERSRGLGDVYKRQFLASEATVFFGLLTTLVFGLDAFFFALAVFGIA